jgi:hypothetical protein
LEGLVAVAQVRYGISQLCFLQLHTE